MSGANGDTGKASADSERSASDLTATYQVLDQLVGHDLADASLVVDVPGLGRQTPSMPGAARCANAWVCAVHAPPGLYPEPSEALPIPSSRVAIASLAATALRPPGPPRGPRR